MPRGWRIGRLGGIDIRVDPSWAVIAALITFNLWATYADPSRFPELSSAGAGLLAVATAAMFFLSVLAHELAHAGVARLRRIEVAGITLFLFGGATHARLDSRGPFDEFVVTAAGPATSAAVGGLFLAVHHLLGADVGRPVRAALFLLGYVNVTLAVFNLVPGFPLDGGRLLRSVLWRTTGSYAKATAIAARAGQAVGALLIAFGLYTGLRDGSVTGLWPALIGWFLYRAASEALADGRRRRRLESLSVAEVMGPPPPTVPADTPVEAALDRVLRGHDGEAFPVMRDGTVIGFVSLRTVQRLRPDQPVSEAMMGLHGALVVGPGERMDDVMAQAGDGVHSILVVEGGRLVGVVEPGDLDRHLRGARRRGGQAPGPPGPPATPEAT